MKKRIFEKISFEQIRLVEQNEKNKIQFRQRKEFHVKLIFFSQNKSFT